MKIRQTKNSLFSDFFHRYNPTICSLLLLLGALAIVPYGDFVRVEAVPMFLLGIAVMSLGFVLSWMSPSITGIWFWVTTILTRLILVPMYPGNDIWRYLWEGYLQNRGFSPYHFPPNATELVHLRPEWWPLINHPDVSAIYPPIAQFGFRALAAIHLNVVVFKLAFILADVLICWLLTRKYSYKKVTLYAWNPLVIYSFAGGAHYDSWFILPLVAAWVLFENKIEDRNQKQINTPFLDRPEKPSDYWVVIALLIGISVAVKWMSLPILGFVVWQAFRKVNLKQAIVVLICGLLPFVISAIPFCDLETCPLIPTSSGFVSHHRSAEFLPYLLGLFWQKSRETNSFYAYPLVFVFILLLWRAKSFQYFVENYFLALLTLSPIVHAWYFTWVIPFAVVTQNLGVRLISISTFVYFMLLYRYALGDSSWSLTDGERIWLWLPFLLGWLWTITRKKV